MAIRRPAEIGAERGSEGPRSETPSTDMDEQSQGLRSKLKEVRFWIDHPSLDDLTAADTPTDRELVRLDVEKCIDLIKRQRVPIVTTSESNRVVDEAADGMLRFENHQLLGVGAFGVVIRASDRILDRDVAIKILRPSRQFSQRVRSRFNLEGEALARCKFEGVVPVYDVGQFENNPYIVMGLIEGPNLAEHLAAQSEPVPPKTACAIVRAIAKAIHCTHQNGILHRDLKPSNVLLARDDQSSDPHFPFRPFVSDFGLAKDFQPNVATCREDVSVDSPIIGTARYMSPEQAMGKNAEVTITSDVYSLGVILYQLLTLRCPFEGGSNVQILHAIAHGRPVAPRFLTSQIARSVDAIVMKCLAKSPKDRYQSALELANDLDNWLNNRAILAKPVGRIRRAAMWAHRNPSLSLSLLTIWLGMFASTVVITALYRENTLRLRQSQTAEQAAQLARQRAEVATGAAETSRLRADRNLLLAHSAYRQQVRLAENTLQNVPQSNAKKLELHLSTMEFYREYAKQNHEDEVSRHYLSVAHHYVANAASNAEQFDLAMTHREKCIEIVRQLSRERPENIDYHYDLFMNLQLAASVEPIIQRRRERLWEAFGELKICLESEPEKLEFLDAKAAICRSLAESGYKEDIPKSRSLLLEAIATSEQLGIRYPMRPDLWKHAVGAASDFAQLENALGNFEEARQWSLKAIQFQKLYVDDHFAVQLVTECVVLLNYINALEGLDDPVGIEQRERYAAICEELQGIDSKYSIYKIHRCEMLLRSAEYFLQRGDRPSCERYLHQAAKESIASISANERAGVEGTRLRASIQKLYDHLDLDIQ